MAPAKRIKHIPRPENASADPVQLANHVRKLHCYYLLPTNLATRLRILQAYCPTVCATETGYMAPPAIETLIAGALKIVSNYLNDFDPAQPETTPPG